jgi:hypothetical protein
MDNLEKGLWWGIIVAVLLGIVLSIVGKHEFENRQETLKRTEILYSIKETETISGWYFIGVGRVKNEEYYYYYIETEKGLKLNELSIKEKIYFILDDDETPRIEKWYGKENTYYKIFLPEDAIIRNFVIG